MLPYLIFGEDSYITIHDNLDSSIPHIKALIDNHALFNNTQSIPLMNGLPRSLFSSPYDLRIILFALLPVYWAIVGNTFLVKLTAFIGMYCLLRRHVLSSRNSNGRIAWLVGLAFALVPFYPDYGISSAGIPLLAYAFLNLKNKENIWSSFFIILYCGLYSYLVLSGLFVCIALFIYMLVCWRNDKGIPIYYFGGLFFLATIYLAINWDLFISLFLPTDFISHRIEFQSGSTFLSVIKGVCTILVFSQYHTGAFFALPILLVFIAVFIFYRKPFPQMKWLGGWLVFIAGMCFFANFLRWLLPHVAIMQEFQFDRFYFLFPALCFVILAVILDISFIQKKRWAGGFLLIITVLSSFYFNPEYRFFVKRVLSSSIKNDVPSYSQFYDEQLFNLIESSIADVPRSHYKIACLGIFPSVLEYNGFFTLDSYMPNYPLSYKHQFREVIASELNKAEELKEYFDNWGSRCYIFSSELGNDFMWGKDRNCVVNQLEINTEKLREMGCTYLFSAVDIKNYQKLNLDFINSYTTPSSFWNIRVYKIHS